MEPHIIDDLIKEAYKLFPKTPVPNYSLSDAIIEYNYGDLDSAIEEEWNNWTEIENWQIEVGYYIFTYAPFEVSLYYLPAFMIWTLKEMKGEIINSNSSVCGDYCRSFMKKQIDLKKPDELLKLEQIKLIKRVLELIDSHPKYKNSIVL